VDLLDVVDGKVVNGFRFAIASSRAAQALRELLLFNAAVFQRLQLQFKITAAADVVTASRRMFTTRSLTLRAYVKFLPTVSDAMISSVKRFVADAKNDNGLDIASSLDSLSRTLRGKSAGKVFASHVTLVNKLDTAMTLVNVNRTTRRAAARRS
jgi:hypothetical protein